MIPIAEPIIDDAEREAVLSVLESGQLADGPTVRQFEDQFCSVVDTDRAVATSNGTTALHAALVGLDIGPDDHVITSPFSFIASANAARLAGASVSFVDIQPDTFAIDPHALESAIRDGTPVDAVIAVHLYGLPADLDHLRDLADTYDFALVEDAAQAHGATHRDRPVGSIGDVGCFSFYPTKNMTTGEGGIITTDREEVAERARRFIDHGRIDGYHHAEVGHNFRMTSIAAAIGLAQLDRLPSLIDQRQENASRLTDGLAETPLTTPVVPEDRTHVFHQYTIRTSHRDRLREGLREQGIDTAVYYPRPIHHQPAYASTEASTPVADRTADEVLSIPVHPRVTEAMTDWIVDSIHRQLEVTH